jgi:hypothetical protein
MKARADLLDHQSPRDTGDSAIWLAVTGSIGADDENFSPFITQQIIYDATCRACQKWLNCIDPSRITARERTEKYCYAQMREAVDGDNETTFRSRCSEMKIPIGASTAIIPSYGSVGGVVRRSLTCNFSKFL